MSPLVDDETLLEDQELQVPTFSPMADAVMPPQAELPFADPTLPAPITAAPAAPPDGADHPMFPVASQTPGIYARTTTYNKTGKDRAGSDPDTDAGRTSTGGPLLAASDKIAGTAAVDPRVIPYGSIIRSGNKVYVAGDTGGAVKSMKASGGKAPVVDFFDDEGAHPDYQHVQVYAPAADYLKLTPEQKLAYHQKAAESFYGLPAGVQLAKSPGRADPEALSPENVQAEIAAASAAPGGMEAGSRKGPLSSAIPANSRGGYNQDTEMKEVRGRFFQDSEGKWSFTPNSGLPENQRGQDINEIPAFITRTEPDGSRVTYQTDDFGVPARGVKPAKTISVQQVPVADLMKKYGLPEERAGDVLTKLSEMNQKGTRGMAVPNLVSAIAEKVKKGMTFEDAMLSIKAPDLALAQKMETDFRNNQAIKQIEAVSIPAYEKVMRISRMPQSQRNAEQDKIVMDAMTALSRPTKSGTEADQKEQEKARGGLPSKITEWKNWLTGNPGANIPDDAMLQIRKAAEQEFAATASEYNVKYEDIRNKILKMGADPEQFMQRNLIDDVRRRREEEEKHQQNAPTTPGAAPAPGKVPTALTTPGNIYIPPTSIKAGNMVLVTDGKGNTYQIPFANVDKADAKGLKVVP